MIGDSIDIVGVGEGVQEALALGTLLRLFWVVHQRGVHTFVKSLQTIMGPYSLNCKINRKRAITDKAIFYFHGCMHVNCTVRGVKNRVYENLGAVIELMGPRRERERE